MKVSIITVCFNSEKTIERCIESVLSQTYSDVEYIVIDGGSTDGTMEIVEKYVSRISVIVSEKDAGIYDAMNKGINCTTGEVIGILNSDDVYATLAELTMVVKQFENFPSVDFVLGNIEFRNFETGMILRRYSAQKFKPYKLRFGWMPPHPASFVKKRVYALHGLYSLDYKISADYERFVHWLHVKKLVFVKLDRTVVHMSAGGASTANIRSIVTLNKEIVKACKDNQLYTNIFLLLMKFPFKLLEMLPRFK